MDELEELKARAAQVRQHGHYVDCASYLPSRGPCKCAERRGADLDRVIAIAESQVAHLDAWDVWFLDIVEKFISQGRERQEARAAALELRYHVGCTWQDCELCSIALRETEWLEQFREET